MLALAALVVMAPKTTVQRCAFAGWRDCWRVTDGRVEAIVVPAINRIMRIGRVGGPNRLWVNPALRGKTGPVKKGDWPNYGGDKLWPAPQSNWGWPPPEGTDGQATAWKCGPDGLELMSGEVPKFGVRFVRIVRIVDGAVVIENRMDKLSGPPQELAVWQVAQIAAPDRVLLPAAGYYPYGEVPAGSVERVGDEVSLTRSRTYGFKVGSTDPAAVPHATYPGGFVRLSSDARGARFPDDGRAIQVYFSQDPLPYVELEANSTLRMMSPGDMATFTTTIQVR